MLRALLIAAVFLAGCASNRTRDKHPSPETRPSPSTSPLTKPALPPLSQPSYHLSEVTDQTLPAAPQFASVTARTTFRDLQKAIASAMTELTAASSKNAVRFTGPPVFIYRGASPTELDKVFTLEIGFPIADAGKASGQVQIRSLDAMKAATISFQGPISAIDQAYNVLIPAVQKRKLRQTGEVREVYNSWEGGDSRNNQVLIAVGVE